MPYLISALIPQTNKAGAPSPVVLVEVEGRAACLKGWVSDQLAVGQKVVIVERARPARKDEATGRAYPASVELFVQKLNDVAVADDLGE